MVFHGISAYFFKLVKLVAVVVQQFIGRIDFNLLNKAIQFLLQSLCLVEGMHGHFQYRLLRIKAQEVLVEVAYGNSPALFYSATEGWYSFTNSFRRVDLPVPL